MSKHDDTLASIFESPTRANVKWADVESLLKYKGAQITQGKGSRVRVALNGRKSVLHKPHPRPDVKKKALESIRDFLSEAGVMP